MTRHQLAAIVRAQAEVDRLRAEVDRRQVETEALLLELQAVCPKQVEGEAQHLDEELN